MAAIISSLFQLGSRLIQAKTVCLLAVLFVFYICVSIIVTPGYRTLHVNPYKEVPGLRNNDNRDFGIRRVKASMPSLPGAKATAHPKTSAETKIHFAANPSSSVSAKSKTTFTRSIPKSTTRKYLTKTKVQNTCPFVSIDPFDPATMKYVKINKDTITCSMGLPSLVYLDGETLRVNTRKVNQTVGNIDYCRYTPLELSDLNDSNLRRLKWSRKFLKYPIRLSSTDEHLLIECYYNKTLVGETFKSRIVEKPEIEKRYETNFKRHVKENTPSDTLNILIVGIDGMSKQNLIRTMPKTRKFILNNLHAKELNKFNKVGENTFPNVLVFLSGQNEKDISRDWNRHIYFDKIENIFTWHYYQMAGYRTSLVLDVTYLTAFHYLKKGWKYPSFDYNSRPLSLQIDKSYKKRRRNQNCVGKTPELVILHDYLHQLTSKFNNSKSRPYFSYNFFTKVSHNDMNEARKADDIYLDFFTKLEQTKVLNNTIVIFFSDHGARFGSFRKTPQGKAEVNTPFVYFMFPPWFEKKYPDVMNTFEINQNRLTTFFDLNKTLMDLLKFKGKTKKGSLKSRGISLFDEIPIERTCVHADIPMQYCNCKLFSNASVPQQASIYISKHLLTSILNKTKVYRKKCALLSLKTVHSVVAVRKNDRDTQALYYQATIETTPGGGVYEALVKYNTNTRNASIVGNIIRLNLYKGQDGCVDSLDLKLYCFCRS